MTTIRFRSVLPALVVLLLSCPLLAYSFIPYGTTTKRSQVATVSSSSRLFLYDKPLPSRPSPRDDDNDSSNNNNNNNDDNDQPYPIQQRLFEFDLQGKEKQNLLPRLSRTLESGIGCYYESTDRKVQNLVKKTDCHPDDAAWALEACKGDITEAWTCISTARRQQLNSNDDNFMSIEEQFEARLKREQQQKQTKKWGTFAPGVPDEQWLPTKNPNPIDDEPWFTG